MCQGALLSNVSSVHSSPRPNLPLPQHTWKALRMRKTRSYASLGLKRLRASCTTSLSSGIRSSTLQAANHQRGVPLKACLVVREGMRCPWCLPQSQFAISGAVHVPVRQRLHPPPQPGTLDDEGGERRLRHLDGWGVTMSWSNGVSSSTLRGRRSRVLSSGLCFALQRRKHPGIRVCGFRHPTRPSFSSPPLPAISRGTGRT